MSARPKIKGHLLGPVAPVGKTRANAPPPERKVPIPVWAGVSERKARLARLPVAPSVSVKRPPGRPPGLPECEVPTPVWAAAGGILDGKTTRKPGRPRIRPVGWKPPKKPGPKKKRGPKPLPPPVRVPRPVGRPGIPVHPNPRIDAPPFVIVRRIRFIGPWKNKYARPRFGGEYRRLGIEGWYTVKGDRRICGFYDHLGKQNVFKGGTEALRKVLDLRHYCHPVTGKWLTGWFCGDWLMGATLEDVIPRCEMWEAQHPEWRYMSYGDHKPTTLAEIWAVD